MQLTVAFELFINVYDDNPIHILIRLYLIKNFICLYCWYSLESCLSFSRLIPLGLAFTKPFLQFIYIMIITTEQKGDLLIHNLWKNWTDSVHYMRVVNTDAKYHSGETPEKCLEDA